MAVIEGTISGETLTGGSANDYIYGYGGNDTLLGAAETTPSLADRATIP